jgi:hypothetical protein
MGGKNGVGTGGYLGDSQNFEQVLHKFFRVKVDSTFYTGLCEYAVGRDAFVFMEIFQLPRERVHFMDYIAKF